MSAGNPLFWLLRAACVIAVLNAAALAIAQPFVAGFERFGRRQEIDAQTAGRLLLTELSCTACHAADPKSELAPKGGPNLDGAGNRLRRDWIAEFLNAPNAVKPGTTMPNVLAAVPKTERDAVISALTAFLGSLRQPFPEIKGNGATPVPHEFWKHGDLQSGRKIFHQVGCVACHAPDPDYETVETKPTALDKALTELDDEELKELGLASAARRVDSIPLGLLAQKYTHQSLTHFLLNPHRTRPAGRMPDFGLGVLDAADVAAWLLKDSKQGAAKTSGLRSADSVDAAGFRDAMLIGTGRQYFQQLGCANCHSVSNLKTKLTAKPLAELTVGAANGCLDRKTSRPIRYTLDDPQRNAINAALALLTEKPVPQSRGLEPLSRRLLALNCLACHERENRGGVGRFRKAYFETVGHVDIGDEGRLPPPLTGVGEKLTEPAIAAALAGKTRLRPHMKTRMPTFPIAQVQLLPKHLQQADHRADSVSHSAEQLFGKPSDVLITAGRQLLDVGCIQCHAFKGETMPGVVGTDLQGIATRLRPEWFREFLLNPAARKPRTRMPTFFPNGRSQNQQVLDGDAEQQVAAMWHYLKDINRQPLPPKIEKARNQSYELIPKARPIVLRTFMKEAGTHAIAVGFPQRTHFAFDAERVRPSIAWRGRFLDAQGTWFVRFAPPADPLGQHAVRFPEGVPLAMLKSSNASWPTAQSMSDGVRAAYSFRGYRLDAAGVPTFLYRYGRFDIEDRIEPGPEGSLKRRLTIVDRRPSDETVSLWLRPHVGETLKHIAPLSYTSSSGLTVRVAGPLRRAGELRRQEQVGTEWLLPIEVKKRATIEVQYQW